MSYIEMVRSHVERCLQDEWEACRVSQDGDGDYPFRHGTAACYVRVEDDDPVMVRVFAHAVTGVRRTAALLTELNDVNSRARFARVFWTDGIVVVEQPLLADTVDRESLRHACLSVGMVADDIGAMVAHVHGGSTPFPPCEETADEDAG